MGKKINQKKAEKRNIKLKKQAEFVCEDCGREFKEKFPDRCICGNACDDFFREKDSFDYQDEKDGNLLYGISYDKQVAVDKLKSYKNPQPQVFIQKVGEDKKIGEITKQVGA